MNSNKIHKHTSNPQPPPHTEEALQVVAKRARQIPLSCLRLVPPPPVATQQQFWAYVWNHVWNYFRCIDAVHPRGSVHRRATRMCTFRCKRTGHAVVCVRANAQIRQIVQRACVQATRCTALLASSGVFGTSQTGRPQGECVRNVYSIIGNRRLQAVLLNIKMS